MPTFPQKWIIAAIVALPTAGGFWAWTVSRDTGLPTGIAGGNGRVEAVEIDVSTKIAGRIAEILVDEGDFVSAGQVLARMDTKQLEAQRKQAEAALRRAEIGVKTAESVQTQRKAEREAAVAVVAQRKAQLDTAHNKLERSEQLFKTNTTSRQTLDDDRASAAGAEAAVRAAEASQAASEATVSSAEAQIVDARAAVEAARAALESIVVEIDDGVLRAPRDGRVQYRVAQPGEILGAGGRVLNLVDLSDVAMVFFLPTADAGRLTMGGEVRLVLDAAPRYVIPAEIKFVADVAQFTPKTVETTQERQKLMFRVKAKIPPSLLTEHIRQVKTGLPGMAYVRIDPRIPWPARLSEGLIK